MDTIELIKRYPGGFYYIHALHWGEKKDYLMIGNSKESDGGAAAAWIDYFFIDSSKVDRVEINENDSRT
jgi:FMN phosphatase YigB (HAD superfamily)